MTSVPEVLQALLAVARQGLGPQNVPDGNVPYVLVPEGCKVQPLPELVYNDHAETPGRVKAKVSVFDPESFTHYYLLFSDPDSRIFADETAKQIIAILDYHESRDRSPRWGQHRVTLTLRESEQWKAWGAFNNKQFTQQAFAEFLEQNAIDITAPAPAAMREMAGDLQATTEVDFGSSQRTNDGQVRFKYTETTKTSVGGNAINCPDHFMLTIPVFVGAPPTPIYAFLRYRIKDQRLVFWYTLLRAEEAARQNFLAARNQIAEALSITILNGVPSA